jgi:hypothetical protein
MVADDNGELNEIAMVFDRKNNKEKHPKSTGLIKEVYIFICKK